jgi:RNA binding exosome subunit
MYAIKETKLTDLEKLEDKFDDIIQDLSEKIDELEYTTERQSSDISQVENDNHCLENRVDDSKYLHVRLELDKLVSGEICLANKNTTSATVKGRFKIESYPGDSVIEVISNLIETLIDDD